jgi:uncharacterized protein (DUF983 family)
VIKRAAAGVWDFLVGDDWLLAVGSIVVLLLTWALASLTGSWVIVLVGVPLVLVVSLRRATRRR